MVVPGLIDAHAWAAPTADLDADYFYLMGLAHGVTGYRVLNVRTSWGVSQRDRAASGAILAPRIWTSGRGINQGASPDRWLFDAPTAASASRRSGAARPPRRWTGSPGTTRSGRTSTRPSSQAARPSRVRVSGRPGASSMADLAAAGVSSIETLAHPLKAAQRSPDDGWVAAGTERPRRAAGRGSCAAA